MTPEQLREIRLEKGLTLQEMASFLGLKSRRMICYYESGKFPIPGFVVRILELS